MIGYRLRVRNFGQAIVDRSPFRPNIVGKRYKDKILAIRSGGAPVPHRHENSAIQPIPVSGVVARV